MMRRTMLIAAVCAALSGASCETRQDPPNAVETTRAVPVPCRVAEPQCQAPAYDGATLEMPGDRKVKLFRAETASQADCLRRYREALAACRVITP